MHDKHKELFDLARPFLDTRENDKHTRIAFQFALRLLGEEAADPAVVLPAVIVHDVGWKCVPEDVQLTAFGPGLKDWNLNRVHEVEGARIASDLLKRAGYPQHVVEEIQEIVLGHDSRPEALSLNDAVVKDSDKLWRYSEHGFWLSIKRFDLTYEHQQHRLRNNMEEWFLTPTAKRFAREELELRAGESHK
ncbi:MAG: HD domain-containing protein [Pseudomonadota bacterium]